MDSPQAAPRRATLHLPGRLEYGEGMALQERIFNGMLAEKAASPERMTSQDHVICLEHDPVITLGRSGLEANLLVSRERLAAEGIGYYPTSRGGDITYHGPGQIVCYPLLDLDRYFTDIHRYLRTLEQAVIDTLAGYGIQAGRIEGLTGVWVDGAKICAMGVRASRWIVMHGLALNVDPDLAHFSYIVPCNIRDKAVTSIAALLGQAPDQNEVQQRLLAHLQAHFGFVWTDQP